MKPILAILFLALPILLWGQTEHELESWVQQAANGKGDTAQANLYLKIANAYSTKDLRQSAFYFRKAGVLSKELGYANGSLSYYLGLSKTYSRQGQNDSALMAGKEGLEWAGGLKDSIIIAQLLLDVGATYLILDELEASVHHIEQSRSILYRLGNHQFDGKILDLLQSLERIRHQYRKAVTYGLEAVEALARSGDSVKLCYAYNNLGLNYIELEEFDSARFFLTRAYEIAKWNNDILIQTTYNLNLGYINLVQGKLDSMLPYGIKALELSRKCEMPEYEGLALFGIANYYLSKRAYHTAKQYADSGLQIAYRYNIRSLRLGILPTLSHIAFAMQDTKSGFDIWTHYQELNDSVLNESVTKNTIQIEKRFESEKKENEIKLQRAQLRQKTTLIYLLIGGTLAVILILLLSYRNYRHQRMLQQQRILELETEKQLTATEAILKGEEQERSRLAKDLHDGLGGMLSGIKYSLSTMKENLIMTPANAQAFEHSIHMLDNSISEMRRVAHNLMPESLVKFGLNDAVKDFCNTIRHNGMLDVVYQSFGIIDKSIEQSLSVTVYRIVQELINNIIKHAHAQKAIVQISATETQMAITVEDDGTGMDVSLSEKANGIGWANIQSRVHYHKGTVNIQSEPGKGTSVFIEMPIA